MKYLLIVFITLAIGLTSQAQNTVHTHHQHAFQDTLKTETGYEIYFPYVHVKVDTITHISKVYSYYHTKAYFSINGGKAVLLKKHKKNSDGIESSISVWSEHFTITVSRKGHKEVFKL